MIFKGFNGLITARIFVNIQNSSPRMRDRPATLRHLLLILQRQPSPNGMGKQPSFGEAGESVFQRFSGPLPRDRNFGVLRKGILDYLPSIS